MPTSVQWHDNYEDNQPTNLQGGIKSSLQEGIHAWCYKYDQKPVCVV